jgi:hypothetical protein
MKMRLRMNSGNSKCISKKRYIMEITDIEQRFKSAFELLHHENSDIRMMATGI